MGLMMKIMLSSTVVSFALGIIFGLTSCSTFSDWLEKVTEVFSNLFFAVSVISIIGFFLTLIWGW